MVDPAVLPSGFVLDSSPAGAGSDLPPGFVLDRASGGAEADLPPGFVLDTPPPQTVSDDAIAPANLGVSDSAVLPMPIRRLLGVGGGGQLHRIPSSIKARVIEIMDREGVSDPVIAYERAVMEQTEYGAENGEHERVADTIPGWDVPDDTGAASSAGGVAPPGGQAHPGSAGRDVGDGDRAAEPGEPLSSGRPPPPEGDDTGLNSSTEVPGVGLSAVAAIGPDANAGTRQTVAAGTAPGAGATAADAFQARQDQRTPANAQEHQAEVLRRYGHSDAEISAMTPGQRRARAGEAVNNGVSVAMANGTGARDQPVAIRGGADVAQAARMADQDHSPAQGAAGNAQKGHARWNGLAVSIEAPAGGVRRGVAVDGTPFATKVGAACGYLRGVPPAADGQAPDVFLGPHPEQGGPVYVIDELDRDTGAFRQTKSMIGFQSRPAAVKAYTDTSGKSAEMIGGIRAMTPDAFRDLARQGGLSRPITATAADRAGRRRAELESAIREVHGEAHPDDVALADQLMHQHGMDPHGAFERATLINALRSGDISPGQMESVIGRDKTRALFAQSVGARQADDGNFYAPDPARPGKYLRLVA